ncbi:hypothetical protein PRIPAC_75518 [Pristionchus pacificus]|uniref:Uncharacterized protein n=1 Tax=Pristionchus pacificus TaxID=54126 RepID=A0A2A6CQZ2_PRIPA|nr:hypothetical protein PRIPAC_75518 [Pristionchus pacificus]|eukprot:PDM80540.1 hypothetical protein PRIPAC_35543 [Pristionchus pacificus]
MPIDGDFVLEVIEEEGGLVINQKWSSGVDESLPVSEAESTPKRKRREENGNRTRKISHSREETDDDDDTLGIMPEFQDRLEYLDERYEHLKKHIKMLKQKMQSLEAIIITGEESDTAHLVREIIDDLKKEKMILRDEAAIIRGEFNQATYKEEGRLCMSGDKRRAEAEAAERERWLAEREERMAREAEERERKRQERLKELEMLEEEQRRRGEIDRQRAAAMDRLKNIHLYEQAEAAAAELERSRQEKEAAEQATIVEMQLRAAAAPSPPIRSPKRNAICSIRSFFCRSPKKTAAAAAALNGDHSAKVPLGCNGCNGHGNGMVNGQTVIGNGHVGSTILANGNGIQNGH